MKTRYKVKRLGKHWWILGDGEFGPYGPYDTSAEAEDTKRGLLRCENDAIVSVDSPFWNSP